MTREKQARTEMGPGTSITRAVEINERGAAGGRVGDNRAL